MAKEKLAVGEDGMVAIDGFSDVRVGTEYEMYRPTHARTDRISVMPNVVLITKDNVEKIKPKLTEKKGFIVKRKEEVDGKKVEQKYFVGHIFKGAFVHFCDQNFRCLGKGKICCKLAPKDSNLQIPVPVLKWLTDKEGNLANEDKPTYEFMIWCLNEATFARLRTQEKEWPLIDHDMKIKGKQQGRYVRIENITPTAETLWRKLPEDVQEDILAEAADMYDKKVQRFMGRRLTEEQVKDLFKVSTPKPESVDASKEVDVEELVKGLGV